MRDLFVAVVVLLNLLSLYGPNQVTACDAGWFGPRCRYKCRCYGDSCSETGSCVRGVGCHGGWFGPDCQYADVAYLKSKMTGITDGNDNTCGPYTGTDIVSIPLDSAFPFTWMRIHFGIWAPADVDLHLIKVMFRENSSLGCTNQRKALVDKTTLDIHCDVNETVQYVTVVGVRTQDVCSVYISGGRNVALQQPTSQSSNYYERSVTYGSDKAVDGNINTNFYHEPSCSHTAGSRSFANWSLTFSQPEMVNRYFIYNRNSENQGVRLIGFTLQSYQADGTKVADYTDQNLKAESMYSIAFPGLGSVVSRVEIQARQWEYILTLCEVEIYGDSDCKAGQYGRDCEYKCNCVEGEACFVSTGGCPSGCADGYTGEACDKPCDMNKHGRECSSKCSDFCVSSMKTSQPTCYHINGACLYGCKPGYHQLTCTEACNPGEYGANCRFRCSEFCLTKSPEERSCDHVDGRCMHGCMTGYHGLNCSTPCESDQYGYGCSHVCSPFCATVQDGKRSCDIINGTCLNGCADGYRGEQCLMTCEPGTHGAGCQVSCSEFCVHDADTERSCDHTVGTCLHGCLPGYVGDACVSVCEPGSYGQNCTEKCSQFCLQNEYDGRLCENVNGTCLHGCQSGYEGDQCMNACTDRRYGPGCRNECSKNCLQTTNDSSTCDPVNGTCLYGCVNGFMEPLCLTGCESSLYGPDCQKTCSDRCLAVEGGERSCDSVNGTCLYGCVSGYDGDLCSTECMPGTYGQNCSFACSQFCIQNTSYGTPCDHISGNCLYGCVSGYEEPPCLSRYPVHDEITGDPPEAAASSTGLGIGIFAAVVVVIVVVVVIGVIWHKRRAQRRSSTKEDGLAASKENIAQDFHQYLELNSSGGDDSFDVPRETSEVARGTHDIAGSGDRQEVNLVDIGSPEHQPARQHQLFIHLKQEDLI